MSFYTVDDVRLANARLGHHWFEPATMRFFACRILGPLRAGCLFVTSEKPPHGARRYTVRLALPDGSVDTVAAIGTEQGPTRDGFCAYKTAKAAHRACATLAAWLRGVTT